MRTIAVSLLSLVVGAWVAATSAASAQTAPPAADPSAAAPRPIVRLRPRDPIANLLNPNAPESRDEDEPDTVGKPKGPSEPDLDLPPLPSIAPSGPVVPFAAQPRSQRDIPVNIDQTNQTPDAPPDARALAYDARIRGSFAAAQGYQGPLDGGWTLVARGQEYGLQIVDRRDRLEAVWRDLHRVGALTASGLVDEIQRSGGVLTIRLNDPATVAATITLREAPGGSWAGKMARGDELIDVTLRRTSP